MKVLQSPSRPSVVPSLEEKTAALNSVLSSHTFQKSDLLIKFLKFVCEKELAGQGDQITEYSIATEALGRPANFSPESDSSVRSRAHALRRKLDDCYREELQTATLRISLRKGSYIPEFLNAPVEFEVPVAPASAVPEPPMFDYRKYGLLALAFAAGIGATLLGSGFLRQGGSSAVRNLAPEVLRQAWGPLLTSDSEVMVVVGIPKQFWARDFSGLGPPRNENWYPAIAQDQQLQQWFNNNVPTAEKRTILLHPNVGSPLWGDVAGALGAVKTLAEHGIQHQVLPERVVKPYALRGRNVLLFGNPEYSPAIRGLLQETPYRVEYDPASRWEAVFNHQARPGEAEAFRRSRNEENFGVITVIGERRNDARSSQIVVFSGLTSAGTQAAEEFFASPGELLELKKRFESEGIPGWPQSYQVVVEATTDINLPIKHRYQAHRVLNR